MAVDVAIIGGGFTGLSAALHLAQKGVRVALAEARMIGFGGSGRNVGLVNAGLWTKPDDVIATLGPTLGARLLRELGDGPDLVFSLIDTHAIDCEAERHGTLHMAIGEAGLKEISERQAQWSARGAPVSVVAGAAVETMTGARGFSGGLLDRRAGTIQPLAYARGLARAAIDAGATILTQTPLRSAERQSDRWALHFEGGSITARHVIMATNAYGNVLPKTPLTGYMQALTPLPYFQFATKPLPDDIAATVLPGRHGCWDTGLVMTSFRLDRANRMIFGSIGGLDAVAAGTHRAFAIRSLNRIFPQIGPVDFDYAWDGQIGMTTDHMPRLHRPAPNVVSISGCNGRGISPGTVFGRALAAFVTGDETAIPLAQQPIVADRWRSVRAAVLRAGAQARHLIERRF